MHKNAIPIPHPHTLLTLLPILLIILAEDNTRFIPHNSAPPSRYLVFEHLEELLYYLVLISTMIMVLVSPVLAIYLFTLANSAGLSVL